jgi:hypothetical protein
MKHNLSKFFTFISFTLIATVILAACAPAAVSVTTRDPGQRLEPQVKETGSSSAQAPGMATNMPSKSGAANPVSGIDPLVFKQAVRKLWEDHITWTRVYIISAVAGLPELDVATQRLLQNQVDIGNAIKPFYGEPAGDQLTSLLKDHILSAAAILSAAKAGDSAKLQAASKDWYENANQIAGFLNSANPNNWALSDMQRMMKNHLDLTLQEATARLKGDWSGDIAAYDKVHSEILDMADMLSDGIIKQFPEKFAPEKASAQKISLSLAMNKLWEDHVTWTRVYIMSVTSGLPDADAAAQRLLQNQVDIGNAIKPLYGEQAGDQLTSLLRDHILTAADILAAAKAGDKTKLQAASTHWYDNANQIASFLNSANPQNWPLSDLQTMMKTHLDLTLGEATARLHGDWKGDVTAYDKVHGEILEMAGMLTEGIVGQFPDQFK